MEPLSLAVSIIEVLEAASTVLKITHKLVKLRKTVSKGVELLNKEVSATHFLIQSLDSLLVSRTSGGYEPFLSDRGHQISAEDPYQTNILRENLNAVKGALLELETTLVYELTKADGSASPAAWLRRENKVKVLQKRLESARQNLDQSINAFNL